MATKFQEMVRDTYFSMLIMKQDWGDDQHSLLDLIFTNEEGMIDAIKHNAP